jgi:hypothetical protein
VNGHAQKVSYGFLDGAPACDGPFVPRIVLPFLQSGSGLVVLNVRSDASGDSGAGFDCPLKVRPPGVQNMSGRPSI